MSVDRILWWHSWYNGINSIVLLYNCIVPFEEASHRFYCLLSCVIISYKVFVISQLLCTAMHTKDKIRYRNFLGIGDTYAIITLNQAPNIPSSTIVQSKSMQTQYRSENSEILP